MIILELVSLHTTDPMRQNEPGGLLSRIYVMRCAIWYHLRNLKNVKNTHGGVLILVKLQAEAKLN